MEPDEVLGRRCPARPPASASAVTSAASGLSFRRVRREQTLQIVFLVPEESFTLRGDAWRQGSGVLRAMAAVFNMGGGKGASGKKNASRAQPRAAPLREGLVGKLMTVRIT